MENEHRMDGWKLNTEREKESERKGEREGGRERERERVSRVPSVLKADLLSE